MKHLVENAGLQEQFHIESAATSTEELGNPVYPPARRIMAEHGIDCKNKSARQIIRADYENFDYIVAMDKWNIRNMRPFFGNDPEHKISLLLSWANEDREVADPWYTGDFTETWKDVNLGCEMLLAHIMRAASPRAR